MEFRLALAQCEAAALLYRLMSWHTHRITEL